MFLKEFSRLLRFVLAFALFSLHTANGPRRAGFQPSPRPSPILSPLALPRRRSTTQRIYIPKIGINGKILHSNFTGHFGSGLAAPHDAELRLGAQVQNIYHVSRLQLSVYALQGCAATADGAQAGGLGEGAGMCVHAPDLDRKVHENARLTAPIHLMLLGFEWGVRAS
jgi:hypothetical protein